MLPLAGRDDIGVTGKGQGNAVRQDGYAMAALLVGIAVMSVLMTVAMPAWKAAVQREREEELVFRGEQYARAVGLFQRKFAGAFPPTVEVLVQQKFLRKAYKDPVTGGDFQVLYQNTAMSVPGQATQPGAGRPGGGAVSLSRPGQTTSPGLAPAETGPGPGLAGGTGQTAGPRGGIIGVTSKSTKQAFKLYKGRGRYNEWQFVYTQTTNQPNAPGQTRPGLPGGVPGSTRPGGVPGGVRPGGMTPPSSGNTIFTPMGGSTPRQ
jgi:type II secretory pathway pseudopilin PulG